MPRTVKPLHKPGPHFAEIAFAFAQIPPRARDASYVALLRFATDLGWDDDARSFAVVLCGLLEDLNDGKSLATLTEHVDGIEAKCKDGSLAWIVASVDTENL